MREREREMAAGRTQAGWRLQSVVEVAVRVTVSCMTVRMVAPPRKLEG